jgi:putative SOS response-associated peptidase YedK
MCSRFELNVCAADLFGRFGLSAPPDEDAATRAALDGLPRAELRPTDRVPVIGPRRVPVALPWGWRVDWDTKPLINARAETLDVKPTFRGFVGNRCLVPATAFFEWTAQPGAPARARKRRHRIARADGADLGAFAGLVDDRGCFTIITRAATEAMAPIHHRMPAMLADETAEAAWLDPAPPFAEVAALLTAWDGPLGLEPPPAGDETGNSPEPGAAAPSQGALF